MRAIPIRTNYLTAKGLDHWQKDCGLNFLIFHLEEAARFAEVDELVQLTEAARSAGISLVISLQKATQDRIKVAARYNLGANMCFGVKMKRDAQFGLSEYAIESGAQPHRWQDRYPGRHFLEAQGLDATMAGNPLISDWIDIGRLEQEVDNGADIRTPLDNTTADALGLPYRAYRDRVAQGKTDWQELRRNRGHDGQTWEMGSTIPTQETLPFNVVTEQVSDTRTSATVATRAGNLNTDPEETAAARAELRRVIDDFAAHGKMTFFPRDVMAQYQGPERTNKWFSDQLAKLVKDGVIRKQSTKDYEILSSD
jgi:hypothetical protein